MGHHAPPVTSVWGRYRELYSKYLAVKEVGRLLMVGL